MRLLIHHHAIAFLDTDGGICLPSFIGRWVDALALHFDEIGLLLHQSERRDVFQDEKISRSNVHLISLGKPGRTWDHFSRIRRIRRICYSETLGDDVLLVRGITPRQYVVWMGVRAKRKVFLLVGDPVPLSFRDVQTLEDVWTFVITRYRVFQLRTILQGGINLVNAPNLIPLLETRFGVKADFIPTNSIRLNEFISPEDVGYRKSNHPLRLLFCGRVARSKGIVEILEALLLLRNSGLKCILDVIGSSGEGDQLQTFQEQAQNLGISELIQWHGRISYGPKLFERYKFADILLLPTYTEGFPHVLWEAAANGCAIITTPVGGIPYLMVDHEHAFFVNSRSAESIFDAVTSLSKNDELRTKMILSAYLLAKEYSVENCADRLSKKIKNLIRVS